MTMLHKRIIVCLDIQNGRVARDVCIQDLRGVTDPALIAACYEAEGADEILFLDSSTSEPGRGALLDAVRNTAERLFVPLNVSLDVTDVDGIGTVLRAGADKVSLGTAAVSRPELISEA
ncbi:MAG: HisA/HisF-related TIM barrel protein, partial [Planctomycetaceae bacterium]